MKAVVFHGPRDFRYEDYAEPQLTGERDLIIRVQKCSICGSDLHMYNGKKLGPLDYSQVKMNFCVGHEAIGEVVETGKAVTRHRVGDRILLAGGVGCGKCKQCQRGAFSLCEAKTVLPYGFSPLLQGLQAEFALVKEADLSALTIPDGVSDEQALLLTDSLATGFMGAEKANVRPGSSVAVIGQGPIGKTGMESAFALGAERVYVIDPSAFRREKAALLGAVALTPAEAQDRILQDTHGLGVDCVIEAVGKEETVKQAIRLACAGGNVAILGVLERGMQTSLMQAQLKSLTIFAGVAGVADAWPQLVPLLQSGKIRGDGMFTQQFALRDAAEAFALFNTGQDTVMKVLINVG
jgi:alcohol dehydrogenase